MKKNYMTRGLLLLGMAAVCSTAYAAESGKWVDVTRQYMKEVTYMPGWQGVITACGEGVAEVWSAAFRAYQNLGEMPAGEYTLTADALYRCSDNEWAKANMKSATETPELYTAYIFINDAKTPVKGLFDGRDAAPNSLGEANTAFAAGEYKNEVKYTHKGGELIIGIANTGCYHDEWCAFDNFKLTGPEGEIEIENGDFATGLDAKRAWNCLNADSAEKTPDMQKDNATGGNYRKCGGSAYKYGQQITLPAGTYRFGMLTFHRYGSTLNPDGTYYNHKSGEVGDPYGRVNRTPKDWFEANDYEEQATYDHAYIYMSKNADCPNDLNYFDADMGDLTDGVDVRTRIKDVWEICNGDYAKMPDNNPYGKDATVAAHTVKNKCEGWHDSGNERESAAAFVNEPEKYYQYVEFTLTEETTVWVGMGKNSNTGDGYWHPWADQTLYKLDGEASEEPSDEVVETVGTEDCTTGWWTAWSKYYTIPADNIQYLHFINHTSGAGNWNNWNLAITTNAERGAEGYSEYAVIRSDLWGWGTNFETDAAKGLKGTLTSEGYDDWDAFRQNMEGADVVIAIIRDGANIKVDAVATCENGHVYHETVEMTDCGKAEDPINAFLIVDNSYLEILKEGTKLVPNGSSAVKAIEIDFNAPVEYYNLNGVRVNNPDKGIYIIKQGKKTVKAVIR